MKISALLALIPACAAAALAATGTDVTTLDLGHNASDATQALDKRALTFTYWVDKDFKGAKGQQANPVSGKCYGLSSTYNDKVSSVGPDRGLSCAIFEDYNCLGNYYYNIQYPGYADLGSFNFNDKMSSWSCTYT